MQVEIQGPETVNDIANPDCNSTKQTICLQPIDLLLLRSSKDEKLNTLYPMARASLTDLFHKRHNQNLNN